MSVYTAVSIFFVTAVCSYQSPVRDGETDHGRLEMSEVPDKLVAHQPITLLGHTFPKYVISDLPSPNDIIRRRIRRSSGDLSATSREGRFLFKFGIKQLQNLILWSSFLANTLGTGTISTTNSFNLFGKTINSALSIAYGDRLFIPPGAPPPVPPVLPVVRPVLPIVPPFPRPPFPLVPVIPPVTATANEVPSVLLPITASAGAATPPISGNVKKGNAITTKGSGQTDETKRQLLEEYMELEKKNQQLLAEYNIIREQQKMAINQNEQWKGFIKQHNLMVGKLNGETYSNIARVHKL